jgi:Ca2+-binding RTX toxin-like protein
MSVSTSLVPRRGLSSIVIGATIGALLAVPFVTEAASAATPRCFGQKATIVGTKGNDVIKGTPRADVIVAKGGNDVINGGGGKDRICGGTGADKIGGGVGADWISGGFGNDTIGGYKGDDKLFGNQGHDRLVGYSGNDRLNGGAGTDRCIQGAGSGAVKNCEEANLSVVVSSPKNAKSGEVTFTVTVSNDGPSAAIYSLDLAQSSQKATCVSPDWEGSHAGAVLAAGADRDLQVVASCTKDGGGAKVMVDATVSSIAFDPDVLDNTAQGKTNLK